MIRNFEISTKITLTYAGCFIFLLLFIELIMYAGFWLALYRPAGKTIDFSMEQVKPWLDNIAQDVSAFDSNTFRQPLVTGVVVRVFDDNGILMADTDPNYLANEIFEDSKLDYQPFFADDDKEVALIVNALVYRAKMDYFFHGEHFTLYFYRTITSEVILLDKLKYLLMILDLFGIIFAVAVGHFMSRKVLKPIKIMTEHAQNIAYGKMDGRIEINPTDDELTELAKTFNNMLDRIQGGINQQQEFVIAASHELINPATAISTGIDFLKHYGFEDKESFNENVDIIFSEIQNIGDILQNMLFLFRTDQNCLLLDKENFDLSYVVEDVMKKMKRDAKAHNFELVKNDFVNIYGDKKRIRQLLRIFLDNAVKYTPDGGRITVTSKNNNGTVQLSIADNGIGIAPENINRIFDRFFRVKDKALEKIYGGGLGLSIAKWIADNHGIKIDVESALGEGTTFTLTIAEAPISFD